METIVIVGAGHAGVQAAASLREEGFPGRISLISAEPEFPYQRPPLSKAFLKGQMDLAGLPLRGETFFREHDIDLALGAVVARIDRAAKRIEFDHGGTEPYDHLILATGARARVLRAPGLDLEGVHALRAIRDAAAIKAGLASAHHVVIVGAGFIGLEIAATARALQRDVTIVEIADRPMGRAVSPATSAFFREAHEGFGARFLFGHGLSALHGEGKVREVELADGTRLPADLVVVGVGVTAEDGLALEAGLDCADGVVVDARLVSSDPAISAIGDCARFPHAGLRAQLRLESVQNATDQAKTVARRLAGHAVAPYDSLPWFWSDQGDLKLQIAGLSHGVDCWVARPGERQLTTFGFVAGKLAVVETVNRGGDHMAARRLLAAGTPLTPEQAADASLDLRKLALGR
jgi:3-phenylpropionate/trans-cinnamate dioxygenase ferredoxin reductase subunit